MTKTGKGDAERDTISMQLVAHLPVPDGNGEIRAAVNGFVEALWLQTELKWMLLGHYENAYGYTCHGLYYVGQPIGGPTGNPRFRPANPDGAVMFSELRSKLKPYALVNLYRIDPTEYERQTGISLEDGIQSRTLGPITLDWAHACTRES